MSEQRKKVQHLLLRAGFGENPELTRARSTLPIDKIVDVLFSEADEYRPIDFLPKPPTNRKGEVGPLSVLKMVLGSKQEMERLNLAWIERMKQRKGQLRERMTFFWHNHFATSAPFAWLMQEQNNMLRKHALGSFRKMLQAIARDPAMIIYLNNQQNKKKQPNENFAREVMELFTLGIGHYTEQDIKEAARAFTGWKVDLSGSYFFEKEQHDFDSKTVLGHTGNFDGGDVIDILLGQKQTARFICRKLYREFVNTNIDEARVEEMATLFFESDYDIAKLMRTVFTSGWFYDEKNIGSRIASPIELLVRYSRLTGLAFEEEKAQLQLQNVLGQVLFFPPNVAGWKGGRNWIDSSSLLIRLSFPKVMIDGSGLPLNAKPAFEEQKEKETKVVKITVDWKKVITQMNGIADEDLESELMEALIQSPTDRIDRLVLRKLIDRSSREKRIVSTAAAIMSLPEFQLI